jgi:hypothetical protein
VFSSVRNITFVQISSIQVNGRSTVCLGRKLSMLEAGGSTSYFLVRIELACERNTCYLKVFGSRRIIHFKKNTFFRWNGETHVSYRTINCVRGWSVLHIVSLWELSILMKRILLTSHGFQMWGTSTLCKIAPLKWMEEHCISWKKTMYVRNRKVYHIVSLLELIYFVKGILDIWKCFVVGESFTLWKIPCSDEMEKHMYHMQK